MPFASVIIQKSYIGLYSMPVYTNPEMKKIFPPEHLALLKGKSCFQIKTSDARRVAHIQSALASGFRQYKKNGWA